MFAETQTLASDWLAQQNLIVDALRQRASESVESQVLRSVSDNSRPSVSQVTSEELSSVTQKLRSYALGPPSQLAGNESLYLEQQLSDLLGFDVATVLDGRQLPHNAATMSALPHQQRSPEDTLEKHRHHQEAGLQTGRSQFGWFVPNAADSHSNHSQPEEYSVTVQLQYLDEWQSQRQELKKWYRYRKIVVINPFERRATIAAITGVGPTERLQYQCAGSPEVIRETMVWSLASQGKVLLFYVDDPEDTLALGPVSMPNPGQLL